jgi:voltage-gated potassium channel
MLFAAGLYLGERGAEGTTINSYGRALYWGIAAFSTAGIAEQIIDTIEYNLEQLDDLSIEELELLKETTDSLIEHVERLKAAKGEAMAPKITGNAR